MVWGTSVPPLLCATYPSMTCSASFGLSSKQVTSTVVSPACTLRTLQGAQRLWDLPTPCQIPTPACHHVWAPCSAPTHPCRPAWSHT